jgi:hypothetical protein
MDPWIHRAGRVVADEFPGATQVGWKDPRMSLLLPFWRRVVDVRRTVVVLRDPREVAGSLAARDEMHPEVAADLWLRYTVTALRDAQNPVIVRYEAFFEGLDAAVDRLVEELGVDHPAPEARRAIGAFFDPSLRHHRANRDGNGAGPLMRAAAAIHPALAEMPDSALGELLARGWQVASTEARLDRVSDDLADIIRQRDTAIAQRDEATLQASEARAEMTIALERTRIAGEALARAERLAQRLRSQAEALRSENHSLKKAAMSDAGSTP